jgi:YjbE family integral membrane protein
VDSTIIASSVASAGEISHSSGFLISWLQIILIDIILSGDNSIVIAMAVHSLPADKRTKGILIGTSGAVILRVLFTTIASHLLQVPFIKMVGGLLILWIAVKLLLEESEVASGGKKVDSLWHAVWIILVADFTMSLDNVLAVAGAAHGNALQLWGGLALSIPLVIFASSTLSKLMVRFPIILLLGAAVLGKVGGEMIFTDPALVNWFKLESKWLEWGFQGFCAAGVLLLSFWLKSKHKQKEPSV